MPDPTQPTPFEQLPLLDFDRMYVEAGQEPQKSSISSKAWARCPEHRFDEHNPKLTGLIAQGEHLVWRLHYVQTASGAVWACRGSGVPVCQLPPRIPAGPAADCRHPFTRKPGALPVLPS